MALHWEINPRSFIKTILMYNLLSPSGLPKPRTDCGHAYSRRVCQPLKLNTSPYALKQIYTWHKTHKKVRQQMANKSGVLSCHLTPLFRLSKEFRWGKGEAGDVKAICYKQTLVFLIHSGEVCEKAEVSRCKLWGPNITFVFHWLRTVVSRTWLVFYETSKYHSWIKSYSPKHKRCNRPDFECMWLYSLFNR